jgi:spore maturation protein CgeB
MRFIFYTHSLVSDWNHGNAHFLRGLMRELVSRGHEAIALEPENGWSRTNLLADRGPMAIERFRKDFPELIAHLYGTDFDHEAWLAGADVVFVHEWTDPALVERVGRARRQGGTFTLLFHDTHHRAVSAGRDIFGLVLDDYDAVLAFGETLRARYVEAGWGSHAVTFHEAADDRLFRPHPEKQAVSDLIWIGNWGDDERTSEIETFLIEPVRRLGIGATVCGVRYPGQAREALADAGIRYEGWIANADVPTAFASHRVTVHIPRRPYVQSLPGIPTIRMFEALACGIPLVSAPWEDSERLFRPGRDFLFARDTGEMTRHIRDILHDQALAAALAASGRETIAARHTCGHRVDQLLSILADRGSARVAHQLAPREAAQ